MDTRWKHPFTCIVAGPTMCGKTVFVKRFLHNLRDMCNARFDRILFYYDEWQDSCNRDFKTADGRVVEFYEGLPQPKDDSQDNGKKKLVILDDLMRECVRPYADSVPRASSVPGRSKICARSVRACMWQTTQVLVA